MESKTPNKKPKRPTMPSTERVQAELGQATSMDDFFGKEGIFARLFTDTLEQMLEGELSEHLGYEPYEAKGRNSGNNRNGHYPKKIRTSGGDATIQVPRDRNGDFEPQVVAKYAANTNELEEKIIGMYAKGMSTRDVQDMLAEMYGVDVSASTISQITEKVWPLVEAWQSRPWKPFILSSIWMPFISSCAGRVRWLIRLFTLCSAWGWMAIVMSWVTGSVMAVRGPISG